MERRGGGEERVPIGPSVPRCLRIPCDIPCLFSLKK